MKTKIYFLILLVLGLAACTDLDELNENPNDPTPDMYDFSKSQISGTLRDAVTLNNGYGGTHIFQRLKSLHIDHFSQMLDEAGSGWVSTRNYFSNDGWTIDYWNAVPAWITPLNTVIYQGLQDPTRINSVAVAKIWRVYIQSQACDFFGVMPFPTYKELVDIPPYISVEDQYTEFFAELDEAVQLFDADKGFLNKYEDLIFEGDMTKWIKFANSLRLRLALRVSEVNPSLSAQEAQAAINGGVMESSSDDAKCSPLNNSTWGSDYSYTLLHFWTETQHMTTTFEKLVTNIGGITWPSTVLANVHPAIVDPRAAVMFDPSADSTWKGVPPGLHNSDVNVAPYKKSEIAVLGKFVVGVPGDFNLTRPYDVMLYEEVCFLKAEAYARGLASGGNAKTEYEAGVQSSFNRWDVSGAATYLASSEKNIAGTSANYDDVAGAGNTALEKIITQKYIALFPDMSLEAWSDKRRLNLPRFDVLAYRDPVVFASLPNSILDPTSFIKRVKIPALEATNNAVEYNKGVALMGTGGDRTSTNLWWDVNSNKCTSAN